MYKKIASLLVLSLLAFNSSFAVPRIINGNNASEGEWPWMVALFETGKDPVSISGGQFCGGVLIASDLVLTAAHCAVNLAENPSAMSVVVGRTKLSSGSGTISQVSNILIHPDFNFFTLEYDYAVLKLATPVTEEPIAIVDPSETSLWDDNSLATIIGWGATNPTVDIYPDDLKEAIVPIRSDAVCQENLGRLFDADTMVCGGTLSSTPDTNDGTSTCYGDSGGPLVVFNGVDWKLVGLTSWGFACAGPNYSVWSRVPAIESWLADLDFPIQVVSNPELRSDLYSGDSYVPVGANLSCDGAEFSDVTATLSYQWTFFVQDIVTGEPHELNYLTTNNSFIVGSEQIGAVATCAVIATNSDEITATAISLNQLYVGGSTPIFDDRAPRIKKIKSKVNSKKIILKFIINDGKDSSGISYLEGSYGLRGKYCPQKANCIDVDRQGLLTTTMLKEFVYEATIKKLVTTGELSLIVRAVDYAGNVGKFKKLKLKIN